jgi:hypothetical protein
VSTCNNPPPQHRGLASDRLPLPAPPPLVFSSAVDDGEQQKLSDFKAAFKQAPKGKKGGKKTAAAAAAGGKLDGVGTGALAAAKAAVGVDVDKMVTWKKGAPVPYAFLAETFLVGW